MRTRKLFTYVVATLFAAGSLLATGTGASSNAGLLQINGWETMPPGDAAQAVQRSDYPDRYAQWEGWARDFLAVEEPSVEPIP